MKIVGYYQTPADKTWLYNYLQQLKPYDIVVKYQGWVYQLEMSPIDISLDSAKQLITRVKQFYYNAWLTAITHGRKPDKALDFRGWELKTRRLKDHQHVTLELMTDNGREVIKMHAPLC